MFCPRCRFNNPLDARFCNSCGAQMPIGIQQPKTNTETKSTKQLLIIAAIALGIIWLAYQLRPTALRSSSVQTDSQPTASPAAETTPVAPVPDLPPAALRDRLENNYRSTVAKANPYMNFIKSQITKMKGGYALWAVHDGFTQSSFSYGDDAKIVSAWIDTNREDLKKAQIKRVGFKNESGYLGSCFYDLK